VILASGCDTPASPDVVITGILIIGAIAYPLDMLMRFVEQ